MSSNPQNASHDFLGGTNPRIRATPLPLYVGTKWTVTTCSVLCAVVSHHEQARQCTHNVTLWHVRLMFVPPRLSKQRDTISIEESACTAIRPL